MVIFVSSLFEKSVYAQNTTTTATTTTIGSKIPYYVFPTEIEGIEEEILKIPHDAYSVQTIFAKKGDNLTIKFYNTEAEERHTFTLDTPYNINKDLAGAQNTTINFVADKEGIFTYYCVYHLPTMTGKLVVLP
ncbi:MAG TPA: cupredoxin domain-containing protein [Nitrososphaeraceae archaeon]|nr:cupredoxin domain-containing protein [Nitrososphaeraceae archaeon]